MSDDHFDDRLAKLDARFDHMMERIVAFSASIDDGALARIEAEQVKLRTELGKTRVDVMERIDRLQNVITGMRDDMTVNYGATDTVRQAHDNTRQELRNLGDSVSALYRKLTRLETQVRDLKGEP
jgi:uncharacterized coiled-coil DUF342 family protein